MARNANQIVHVGIKGSVVGLDRRSGQEVWRTPLKGAQFVNISLDGDVLLASTRGEVFGLDPGTGRILWNNPLKGLGFGLVTFSSTSQASVMERINRDQAASASAASASAASA